MAKKCTKKHDARAELLFCQSKPIVFWPFSLMVPSSLLKLLNLKVESVVAVTCFYSCIHNMQCISGYTFQYLTNLIKLPNF